MLLRAGAQRSTAAAFSLILWPRVSTVFTVAIRCKRSAIPEGMQGQPWSGIGRMLASQEPSWTEEMVGDWNVIYTIGGASAITLGEARLLTAKGDVLLIRANYPRRYAIGGKPGFWEVASVHFLPPARWQLTLAWPEVAPGVMRVNIPTPELQDELFVTFNKLVLMSRVLTPYAQQIAMNLLENVLLRCEALHQADRSPEIDSRITRVKEYIEEQLHAPFSLRELARNCGLSKTRLCVLFREQVRLSPRAYWERCRLARAQHLLETTLMSVGEISRQVGFENPFYFSQRFRKEFSASPRAYRQQARPACGEMDGE